MGNICLYLHKTGCQKTVFVILWQHAGNSMGREIESFSMTVDECVLRVPLIMKMWFRLPPEQHVVQRKDPILHAPLLHVHRCKFN